MVSRQTVDHRLLTRRGARVTRKAEEGPAMPWPCCVATAHGRALRAFRASLSGVHCGQPTRYVTPIATSVDSGCSAA